MSGRLVLVATPIGNLGDLSPRALQTLQEASVVYCEDTRRSRTLFSANGLSASRLVALHEHNELAQSQDVVRRVLNGETVALVSDAGTPGISDPGSRAVAAVLEAGGVVTTVPGPSAVIAALGVSGLPTERFCMEGFLPRKAGERASRYDEWDHEPRTIVFYESPQRLAGVLRELAERWPSREAAVARELTKLHEEVVRGSLANLATHFAEGEVLGEIAVVLAGAEAAPVASDDVLASAVREALASGASVRDVASEVAEQFGVPHRRVYELALSLRSATTD